LDTPSEVKVVLSDLHLGTGEQPGNINPYEDFHHDERLAELIRRHAAAPYADVPVEVILNGDILDLLKVPVRGRFTVEITEPIATDKVRRCVKGHRVVFDALAAFLQVPGHTLAWLPGNHDPEIAFPRVQALLRARLGIPEGDPRLRFVLDPFLRLPRGVTVTHGHLFESVNRIEPGAVFATRADGTRILNLPFGSRFFTEVLAPFKAEQPVVDLVHPLSSLVLWGMVFDLRFTMRLLGRMGQWLVAARLRPRPRDEGVLRTLQILADELALFTGMDRRATEYLLQSEDVSALIVGHSHLPMIRRLPRNKTYVNTGTWVRMVSLDLRDLGARNPTTFARVEYRPVGSPAVSLLRWRGSRPQEEEVLA
jgi:UDP-2,3-diacylglucosamine pyrophosphatase LpxH